MARALETGLGGLTVLALLVTGGAARGDVVVAPDGTRQPIDRHRALLVHQGSSEVVIEELYVDSRARRALWIKPLPAPPTFAPTEAPFSVLEQSTEVPEPHNQSLRRRVFGPSVITLLSDRLFPDPPAKEDLEDTTPPRALTMLDRGVFEGAVYTSTITRDFVLPDPMQGWLQRNGFALEERLIADLAAHLNRGARVSFTLLEDAAPGSPGLARVGPVRFTMAARVPVFPILRRTDPGASETSYELFVVGAQPLVPVAYSTLWDEEPWVEKDLGRGQFHTRYAHPLEETDGLLIDLEQRQGIALPGHPYLVRSRFRQGNEALGEIQFEPTKNPVRIPGSGQQGSGLDLFLCILLGLTPLIYTPESWFLLWLGGRARERSGKGGPGIGARLWPLFALVVAVYWVVSLEGAARLAAVLPFLVGLTLLVLPQAGRREQRVRVDFKKRKKKDAKK